MPVALDREYWRRVGPLVAFGLVNSADAFLLLRAGVLGLSTAGIVAAYAVLNVANAAAAYPIAALSDRIERRRVVVVGLVLFAVAYGGLGGARSAAAVWLLLPVYGVSCACTDAVVKAWIADAVPVTRRAWGMGLHQGLVGIAALVAAAWTGLLWHGTGRLPLLVAAALALVVGGFVAVQPLFAGRGPTEALAPPSGEADEAHTHPDLV